MDIYAIRRTRLRQIIADDFKRSQTAFSEHTGIKAPQVNRWLSTTTTDPRNITETSARQIEKACGKPPRWLDELETLRDTIAVSPAAMQAAEIITSMPESEQLEILHYLKVLKSRKELTLPPEGKPGK